MSNKVTKIALVAVTAFSAVATFGTTIKAQALNPIITNFGINEAAYDTLNGIANFGHQDNAIIHVQPNGEQTLVGKQFRIHQLFKAENAVDLESINYTFNDTYAPALKRVVGKALKKDEKAVTEYEIIDYIQSLNNHVIEGAHANQTLEGRYSDFRYFVEDLRHVIAEMNIEGDVVKVKDVDAQGQFEIRGLEFGYYLIDEINVGNNDDWSAASLCITNTANPYAYVQVKSDYPSLIKKIQEDDHQDEIGNDGWNDIADYEIGQTVPYKYESNIPDMNGYHQYFYAWHDIMDEALTFNPDSVSIVISDESKSYTLTDDEFEVIENVNGETFNVKVDDIKAIVDREFANFNADKENVYGQSVTLTYNATLNDNAADKTGRPGFENTVRLEFSQNPENDGVGETGFTPWDTVVCFTYRLNGLKINNHDKVLADAHFRLYSDKDCTNEVYVKKGTNGYIVINRDAVDGTNHTGGNLPQDAVEIVSDANGIFNIIGLDGGTYWLKETNSPAGYRELLDPIRLTITPTFTDYRNEYVSGQGATDEVLQRLDASVHIKEFLSGLFHENEDMLVTDVNDGSVNLTVVNTVGTKLPITGAMTGLAIMVTAGGALVFASKKKSRKDEK